MSLLRAVARATAPVARSNKSTSLGARVCMSTNPLINALDPKTGTSVNIVTYNVLSSHLAGPDYFINCDAKYLSRDYRLELLMKMLDEKIDDGAVICLQEISTLWSAKLQPWFMNRGYSMLDTHYGGKFDGNMGVAIAFPNKKYQLLDMDISCIADTKFMPRKPRPTGFSKFYAQLRGYSKDLLHNIGLVMKVDNPWHAALRRSNRMITARLSPLDDNKKKFVIGTYHMPCMFRIPGAMLIHSALSAQHIHRYAGGDPYMYVGDFNIKPDSSMYQLMTTGSLEEEHPEMPAMEAGDNYKFAVTPVRSAYKICNGSEPDFTNNSQIRNEEPFIETLDYIFMSEQWSVDAVDDLPHRKDMKGPLPIQNEPSDHLLLAATVRF
jgi:2',5'-phosphodiesterase